MPLRRHDRVSGLDGGLPAAVPPFKRALIDVGIAVGSMTAALVLTHALWRFVEYTPFIFGFGAAVVSARVGGRKAGFVAVAVGMLEYRFFPPPLQPDRFVRLLLGFGVVSALFSWLVARRYEIDIQLRASQEMTSWREQQLKTILDAEPACVKVVSHEGVLLHMNRAGLDMIGADDLSQVVGYSVVNVVHPDDRDRYLEMQRTVLGGSPARLEFRIIGLKGAERWILASAVPFETGFGGSGQERAVLSVANDITDRKELEAQLRSAQQMEAVGRLAGGVAHDFNNLLTAISGLTTLVLRTLEGSDPRRNDLFEVHKAAQRAAALTQQLLAFSRRQILRPRVLDLNRLLGNVERLLRRTLRENIELTLDLDPAIEPVRADPGQLERVVLNLAVNAGDAMPAGGALRLSTAGVEVDDAWARQHPPMRPGRFVRMSASDTGVGMTPEMQARVFEPFFTTKESGKGTGLGLATVYGIVKQSGGFIWVASTVGRGTTFHVYLPVAHGPIDAVTMPEHVGEVHGGDETILIAEDDGAVRRLTRNVLAQAGYRVLEARDGEEALIVAREAGTVHLLLTDIVMPGLSGRDLARRLAPMCHGIRALYTSGYAGETVDAAGCSDDLLLLPKPFEPVELLRRVRAVLDSPRAVERDQGAAHPTETS